MISLSIFKDLDWWFIHSKNWVIILLNFVIEIKINKNDIIPIIYVFNVNIK
jgi:hypothetical protein